MTKQLSCPATYTRVGKKFGPGALSTIGAGSNYAAQLLESKDKQLAFEELKKLLKLARQYLGDDHYQTLMLLNRLSRCYLLQNDMDRGLPLIEEALQRSKNLYGDDHAKTISATNGLGLAYLTHEMWGSTCLLVEDYQQALEPLRAVYDSRTQHMSDHWLRFNAMSLLGAAKMVLGQIEQAEPWLIEGYEQMLQRKPRIPPRGMNRLQQAKDRLVDLYNAKNMPEKAAEYRDAK